MSISKKDKDRIAPYMGVLMPDGTIFVGLSPTTEQPLYAAPTDAPARLDFNAAAEHVGALSDGGHHDWRMPSRKELRLMQKNKDKGALKDAFPFAATPPEDWYWAADGDNENYGSALRFRDGKVGNTDHSKTAPTSLHCVRDGDWPDDIINAEHEKVLDRQDSLRAHATRLILR
jgi:hypothetical protein